VRWPTWHIKAVFAFTVGYLFPSFTTMSNPDRYTVAELRVIHAARDAQIRREREEEDARRQKEFEDDLRQQEALERERLAVIAENERRKAEGRKRMEARSAEAQRQIAQASSQVSQLMKDRVAFPDGGADPRRKKRKVVIDLDDEECTEVESTSGDQVRDFFLVFIAAVLIFFC
jgi:hypothetical protein